MLKKKEDNIIEIKYGHKENPNPEEIKRIFEVYYKTLYKKHTVEAKEIADYVDKLSIKQILQERGQQLNAPISKEEIDKTIADLKNGKAPGPDNFSAKFYKIFEKDLTKILMDLMNDAMNYRKVLVSWLSANIMLILKDSPDFTNPKNYRPISLLNTNYNIFTKILSGRLKSVLGEYIYEDQVGFLPGRQLKDNLRMLLDINEFYDKKNDKEVVLFFP